MLPVSHTTLPSGTISCRTTDSDCCCRLLDKWQKWADHVPLGDDNLRDSTVEEVKSCLENKNEFLYLAELELTVLPGPLPGWLRKLYIGGNQLTSLPETLPISLEELHITDNQLTALPATLPASLQKLYLGNNRITFLPETLPASLQKLNVVDNQLTSLPSTLPVSLQKLNAGGNRLISLPETLPDLLRKLNVSHNQLIFLPENLPASLQKLYADNNQLITLPAMLPASLRELDVSDNQLTCLPEALPASLEHLDVSDNRLISLPETLPASLWELNVRNNRLTALPEMLPASLEFFDTTNNLLTSLPESLPALRVISVLPDFQGTITKWTDGDNVARWQKIQPEDGAAVFANFLHKLHNGKNRLSKALHSRVREWLGYLSAEENSELRKQTFLVAEEAAASCVDRASFYFNKMYWLMTEDKAIKSGATAEHLIETIRSGFRLQVLGRIAAAHVQRRIRDVPRFTEDVEIYLAYQYRLREHLSLPVYTELQFSGVAALTEQDIELAWTAVLRQEQTDFLRYLVTQSAAWWQRLQSWDSEKTAAVEANYLEAIASADFSEAVDREVKENGLPEDDNDARRAVSKKIADTLLFEKRYQLTREYLIAHKALSCLSPFRSEGI